MIAGDFTAPRDTDQKDDNGHPVPGPIDDGEARLAYVAVTRTRHRLDLGGLSWIHHHPDGRPPTRPRAVIGNRTLRPQGPRATQAPGGRLDQQARPTPTGRANNPGTRIEPSTCLDHVDRFRGIGRTGLTHSTSPMGPLTRMCSCRSRPCWWTSAVRFDSASLIGIAAWGWDDLSGPRTRALLEDDEPASLPGWP
jgi:hypothetical protein